MSGFQKALQQEVVRLARRDLRAELEPLRRQVQQLRAQQRELKAACEALSRELRQNAKLSRAAPAAAKAPVATTQRRFSPERLRAWRERMDLSAKGLATLVGRSAQSVYNWELAATRPSAKEIEQLAQLRAVSKKDLQARLRDRKG